MMSSSKNVLIVGHGSIGNRHREVAENCDSIGTVTTVGQREFDRNVNGKTRAECEHYIQSLAEGVLDFAVIAGPASTHLRTAMIFVDMNMHLIIEKPLSDSSIGVQVLLDTIEEKKLCVSVGYNLRNKPSLQRFKKAVDNDLIGKIYSVRCEVGQYLPDWRPDADYRETVSGNASMGGGVLLELSHEIDYLQWIFGPVQEVSGYVYNSHRLDVDVEDTAHLLFSFQSRENKENLPASVNMDFIRRDPIRQCVAIGEHGSLKWDGIADDVSLYESDSAQWRSVFIGNSSRDESYQKALELFVASIHCRDTQLVSAREGHSVLKVIDAIRHSSHSNGCFVAVEN